MAQKRSESAVSVLARTKRRRRRSQKTLPSTLTPTSLQSPIPLVLSCPWIPTSLPTNLYQCTKKNKVLPSSCHLPFLPHCPHSSPMPSHPPPLSWWTVHHHSSHSLNQTTSWNQTPLLWPSTPNVLAAIRSWLHLLITRIRATSSISMAQGQWMEMMDSSGCAHRYPILSLHHITH